MEARSVLEADDPDSDSLKVAAKEALNVGDRIYLPLSVDSDAPPAKKESFRCSEEEGKFICSLVLYKVLNTLGSTFLDVYIDW